MLLAQGFRWQRRLRRSGMSEFRLQGLLDGGSAAIAHGRPPRNERALTAAERPLSRPEQAPRAPASAGLPPEGAGLQALDGAQFATATSEVPATLMITEAISQALKALLYGSPLQSVPSTAAPPGATPPNAPRTTA